LAAKSSALAISLTFPDAVVSNDRFFTPFPLNRALAKKTYSSFIGGKPER